MVETAARLLRLLTLLQARRDWTGPELADRLGVTARTVRADVDRARTLGYPVHSSPGVGGGYRLGQGGALPPLLLDDDEAVAVAVSLRAGATGGVAGIDEAAVRALVKLEQVLPSRLRHRVGMLQGAMVAVPATGPAVDPDVLTAIAGAIRGGERLRFDYADRGGDASVRDVEPYRLVSWGRRWYLVAWDVARTGWRTFRVDRVTPRIPTGPRFTPRPPPEGDLAAYVQRGVSTATWHHRARVRLATSAARAAAVLPTATMTPDGPDHCIVEVGSDSPHTLALYLGLLDVDFEVLDSPELAAAFGRLAQRYQRAAAAHAGG